jgi:hypothetical protein
VPQSRKVPIFARLGRCLHRRHHIHDSLFAVVEQH